MIPQLFPYDRMGLTGRNSKVVKKSEGYSQGQAILNFLWSNTYFRKNLLVFLDIPHRSYYIQ